MQCEKRGDLQSLIWNWRYPFAIHYSLCLWHPESCYMLRRAADTMPRGDTGGEPSWISRCWSMRLLCGLRFAVILGTELVKVCGHTAVHSRQSFDWYMYLASHNLRAHNCCIWYTKPLYAWSDLTGTRLEQQIWKISYTRFIYILCILSTSRTDYLSTGQHLIDIAQNLYIEVLRNIRWICFAWIFLRHVGHFFCSFTACRRQVSQKTCLQSRRAGDVQLTKRIGSILQDMPLIGNAIFSRTSVGIKARLFNRLKKAEESINELKAIQEKLLTHPQGPQLILSSMLWKQIPHFAVGRLGSEGGSTILLAGDILLVCLLAADNAPTIIISSSGLEVRSMIASCIFQAKLNRLAGMTSVWLRMMKCFLKWHQAICAHKQQWPKHALLGMRFTGRTHGPEASWNKAVCLPAFAAYLCW